MTSEDAKDNFLPEEGKELVIDGLSAFGRLLGRSGKAHIDTGIHRPLKIRRREGQPMSVKPITPNEVKSEKLATIPDSIIQCVNELIAANWDGTQATIHQRALLEMVLKRDNSLSADGIFSRHLFDFEDIFKEAGWIVSYDKPGFNETYDASFCFKKKHAKGEDNDKTA